MSKLEDQLRELERLRKKGLLTDEEYAGRRASIIHDPTNLQVSRSSDTRKGGGLFKWGLIGCLGILAAIGLFFVLVIGLIVAAVANIETDSDDVTVRVDGTPGLEFSGNIGTVGSQRSVDGRVPQSFTIAGKDSLRVFTAVIQKQVAEGLLRVTVDCEDGPRTQETSAEFGVVTVSCSPF
jgi:hypothetical protein